MMYAVFAAVNQREIRAIVLQAPATSTFATFVKESEIVFGKKIISPLAPADTSSTQGSNKLGLRSLTPGCQHLQHLSEDFLNRSEFGR